MEKHVQDVCPLQYIKCRFGSAGCRETFRRKDQDEHMDRYLRQHVELLAKALEKLSEETESRRRHADRTEDGETRREMEQLVTQQKEQNEEELTVLRDKLAAERDRVDQLEKQINNLYINERQFTEAIETERKKVKELRIETLKQQQTQNEKHREEMAGLNDMLTVAREKIDELEKLVNKLHANSRDDISPPEQPGESEQREYKRLEMELRQKERKIEELQTSLDDHKIAFEEYKKLSQQQNLRLESKVEKLEGYFNNIMGLHPDVDHAAPPFHNEDNPLPAFTLDNFSERRRNNERWNSPSFAAPGGGPSLKLEVWPNGQQDGQRTHVSVWFEHVIEKGHAQYHEVSIGLKLITNNRDNLDIRKATVFEITNQRYLGASNKFAAHTELIDYLENDSLTFQITGLQYF